jgi:3-hydroxyisobutyrate dehydrogenase-like beta-hydroxyacid dehydrogenase
MSTSEGNPRLPSVGVVGVGRMGAPMARNLLRTGYPVTICDAMESATAALSEAGAKAVRTPRELGQAVEMALLAVRDHQVAGVLAGPDGLFADLAQGGIIADCGNCDPKATREHAREAAERDLVFLDTAMSGGPGGAAAGTLAFFVGGDRDAYERIRPILDVLGGAVAYCGESGRGHTAKLISQMIAWVQSRCIAEALTLADVLGFDMVELIRAMNQGAARSWILELAEDVFALPTGERPVRPPPAYRQRPNQLTWALDAAHDVGLAMPLAAIAHEIAKLAGEDPDSPVHVSLAQLEAAITGEAGSRPN